MTQQDLALTAGLDVSTIKRLENNKVKTNLTTYIKIIKALQVNSDLIYNDYLRFISSDYSNWIKIFRKIHQLTQRQLSEYLAIHIKTIMRWEQGKYHPTLEQYLLIQQLNTSLQSPSRFY